LVDDGGHLVVQLDEQGRVRLVLGRKNTPGETEMNFNRPTDVAFAPNGDIYVADGYGNSRVMRFDREGRFISAWGKKGTKPGEFNLPHAVAVDRKGRVYVGDRENFRMQLFSAEGKFLEEWTHVGSPWGLAMTERDELFLCDGHANRVVKLTLEGKVKGTFGVPGRTAGRLVFAHHLAVDAEGAVYVAEIKNWRVQKFVLRLP
jgi:DNA-binding beta-propeller fold protein YncE